MGKINFFDYFFLTADYQINYNDENTGAYNRREGD